MPTRPPESSRAVTLRDLAAHCGVSVATVSRALRDPHSQKADTVQRIQAATAALGYDPDTHAVARRLSLRKYGKRYVNLLGLVFPKQYYNAPYFNALLEGVHRVVTPQGFGLLMIDGTRPASEIALPPSFRRGEVDGCSSTASRRVSAPPTPRHARQSRGRRW